MHAVLRDSGHIGPRIVQGEDLTGNVATSPNLLHYLGASGQQLGLRNFIKRWISRNDREAVDVYSLQPHNMHTTMSRASVQMQVS